VIRLPRAALLSFLLLSGIIVSGCQDEEQHAEAMYSTAEFEERQFNREHAAELYRKIIRLYPKTSYAKLSAERLKALEAQPPPQQ
jgi:TolA-binding protein